MVRSNDLAKLAFGASLFALAVIALGAFTRLIDAGLGCPDWPGCYGHLTVATLSAKKLAFEYPQSPFTAYKAWAEMVHRYFVSVLSFFILIIVSCIFTRKPLRSRANCILAMLLIGLLAYQILLGQWTVTLQLLPIIVSQHLLGGFAIVTLLWLIYLNNNLALRQRNPYQLAGPKTIFAVLGLILLLTQIALGAWTSTNYASLSCANFPFCQAGHSVVWHWQAAFDLFSPIGVNYEGGVLPQEVRQTIQMTHRFGALVVAMYLFVFAIYGLIKTHSLEFAKSIYALLGLLCVQLCLGIANVIFKLPLATALAHNLVAVLLLLTLVTIIFKLTLMHARRD